MKIIYSCGCGETDAFIKDAWKILFPAEELPPIRTVEEVVAPTSWSSVSRRQVEALKKAKEKFAIYVDTETDELWDLLKGVRLA